MFGHRPDLLTDIHSVVSDRTNVVQSKLARVVLATQLLQVGMISETAPDIEGVYNDAWANNGDQISREYAGTSA